VATGGISLAEQYRLSGKRARRGTLMLVLPLIAFLFVTFLLPIASMLTRSFEDSTVADILPRTAAALRAWDGKGRPPFSAYSALADDLVRAHNTGQIGKVATRMNFERSGMRSLMIKTAKRSASLRTALCAGLQPDRPAMERAGTLGRTASCQCVHHVRLLRVCAGPDAKG
jgi:putative spermidine/putrescine transport system permease protein